MKNAILFVLLASLPLAARAADEPIDAERPGLTNGTSIVPLGRIQLEGGVTSSRADHERAWRFGDLQLRLPLSARGEFRIGLPTYVSGSDSGFEDGSVGVKLNLLERSSKTPGVAVIGTLIVPSGSNGLRERGVQPQVDLEIDRDLSERLRLEASAVYTRALDNGERVDEDAQAVSLTYQLRAVDSVFVEASRVRSHSTVSAIDGGFLHRVGANTQLDLNAGIGLNGAHPDFFVGAGIARRW